MAINKFITEIRFKPHFPLYKGAPIPPVREYITGSSSVLLDTFNQ